MKIIEEFPGVAEQKGDELWIMMMFESGLTASMELSRNSSYGYDQRIEAFGSNGNRAAVGNITQDSLEVGSAAGVAYSQLVHSFPQRFRLVYGMYF